MIVYKLTFSNGKSYIGQTTRMIKARLIEHRKASNSLAVSRAWRRHGEPIVSILAECSSLEELNVREADLIVEHSTMKPNGYNLCDGGSPCPTRNPEIAQRIAQKLRGGKRTTESRAKMSASAKARIRVPHSEETKAKIAASNKGHDGKLRASAISAAQLNRHANMTPEQRQAFSEIRKRAWETRRRTQKEHEHG